MITSSDSGNGFSNNPRSNFSVNTRGAKCKLKILKSHIDRSLGQPETSFITKGNFQFINRLFAQIDYTLRISLVDQITIEVARDSLVIGI